MHFCACLETTPAKCPQGDPPSGLPPGPRLSSRVTCSAASTPDRPETARYRMAPALPSDLLPLTTTFLSAHYLASFVSSTRLDASSLSQMSSYPDSDYRTQRERSRSPRRRSSRSPRRSRRSYSPRSRSRSRDDYRRSDRRSRSPLSASGAAGSGSPYGGRSGYAPGRTFEDRTVAKENMMQSVRESSQQDRRVYVGNLSYDVKWHHLKDFMRQGESLMRCCLRERRCD